MSGTQPGIQEAPAGSIRRGKDDAGVNCATGLRVWPGFLAMLAVLAVWIGLDRDAATQLSLPASQLVAADPMPNARLTIAPDQIALTFAVPVAPESARIRLIAAGGVEVPLDPVRADPDLPTLISSRLSDHLGVGSYTVVWSARAETDGALLAGAYPFRGEAVTTPGATDLPGQWPAPGATLLRWVIFLGSAIAGGGFAWSRILAARPGRRGAATRWRMGAMSGAALGALLATAMMPVLARFGSDDGESIALTATLRAWPLGWWLQLLALAALVLLCLGVLARGEAALGKRVVLEWIGIGAGLAALGGLALTSHAGSLTNIQALALELLHLWSTALWFSGLLFFLAGWRGLGSDVARFRTVRWVGGLLLVVSIVTGGARAATLIPSFGDLMFSRYGQVLLGKTGVVLVIVALGGVAMLAPRRANALQASRFLGTQAIGAGLAALLSALLALMAVPGMAIPATLAGVALSDVVPLDRAAFDAERGVVHLLTQPATPGPQSLVVRLTAPDGTPLTSARPPNVEVIWTPLGGKDPSAAPVALQADPAGAVFTGTATLDDGWWQAEVLVTPPGGIASRTRFWLVVPDPNVAGAGPSAASDPEATALFERGLASLTALRSVRSTQRLADGAGAFAQSRVSVSAAEGERPAAFSETTIDADGEVVAQQTIVGNRRWILDDGAWVAAEPIPFLAPAAWGEPYAGASGFALGPRETVDGEISQVVTFSVPPRAGSPHAPTWYAWWVGLASGQVRQEAMISTRHYGVTEYRDFNAPLGIASPVEESTPLTTPARSVATPEATPPSS